MALEISNPLNILSRIYTEKSIDQKTKVSLSVPNVQLIEIIAMILDEILKESERIQHQNTVFTAKSKPTISLKDYLLRLDKFLYCSQECFILALIYIDRITSLNENLTINNSNIHRLLFISIIVAVKYLDDKFYKNDYYAKVGGVPVLELNSMERSFVFQMNFRLYVDGELFSKYKEKMCYFKKK